MIVRTGLLAFLAGAMILSVPVQAETLDRRMKIVNKTGYAIIRFYGSNTGTDDWQEDILGADILPSGSSIIINFDDGTGYCKYDLRAVFEDGDEVTAAAVNICETGAFTFR